VTLDVNDFALVGEVPASGLVLLRRGQAPVVLDVLAREPRHCIFEDIYFARPDSVMSGHRVYSRRWALGEELAEEWKRKDLQADVVVAVPDTSRPAAQAMAERLGVPHREGFIKNRYSGRTFIMPDQASREAAMRLKLNPIEEIFRGRRVVIVDDSIVRGTTMRRIIAMVRRLEPAELHVAIFSPAVRNPCFYGIDMPSRSELVAAAQGGDQATVEQFLAERFGADSVTFLSEEGLRQVAGTSICAACFTGQYPVPVNDEERGHIVRDRRPDTACASRS
jgi:amidophosphoribosyltransferase